jgi:hypothetical protein
MKKLALAVIALAAIAAGPVVSHASTPTEHAVMADPNICC